MSCFKILYISYLRVHWRINVYSSLQSSQTFVFLPWQTTARVRMPQFSMHWLWALLKEMWLQISRSSSSGASSSVTAVRRAWSAACFFSTLPAPIIIRVALREMERKSDEICWNEFPGEGRRSVMLPVHGRRPCSSAGAAGRSSWPAPPAGPALFLDISVSAPSGYVSSGVEKDRHAREHITHTNWCSPSNMSVCSHLLVTTNHNVLLPLKDKETEESTQNKGLLILRLMINVHTVQIVSHTLLKAEMH